MAKKIDALYIENLPIKQFESLSKLERESGQATDLSNLPDAIVSGSNLIQFPPTASAEIRSSIALSLLAAQRVATDDSVILTPQQWIDRHNTVLTNLNWMCAAAEGVKMEFKDVGAAVHNAIIPFLSAALGPFAGAAALILTAFKQLQAMNANDPWITLFHRNSRHFDSMLYQFSAVQVAENQASLRLASARIGASFESTQVLFFKIEQVKARFDSAGQTFSADVDLLAEMNQLLKKKMKEYAYSFIDLIPEKITKVEKLRAIA